jgi:hypothetical protein
MKKTLLFAVISATLGALPLSAEVDCAKLAVSVKAAVSSDPSKVLEVVSAEVAAAPACSCEIVKSAIEGSAASAETVAAIVEAAINAAPDQMRLIAQCAIAVAPDAFAKVQAVMAKLDPNKGESNTSAKGAKVGVEQPAGEVAAMPNPLDFPGQGPVGPTTGGPGGSPLLPPQPPIIINPPEVTPG